MATIEKIQKISSKGQITLPMAWRRATTTDTISVVVRGDKIEITPARLDRSREYTIFDAIRDNGGKGIKADDFITVLDKLIQEDERAR